MLMQAPGEKLIFKMVQAKVEAIRMIDIVQVLVKKMILVDALDLSL